jgi:hypothetical protein
MRQLWAFARVMAGWVVAALAVGCVSTGAWASSATPAKFVIFDDQDTTPPYSSTGSWTYVPNPSTTLLNSPAYGWSAYYTTGLGNTAVAPTATAIWTFNDIAIATGSYAIDIYMPAVILGINDAAPYSLQVSNKAGSFIPTCDGTQPWTDVTTFTFDQNAVVNEGQFRRALPSVTLTAGKCYRLVLRNNSAGTGRIYADAVRVERLFESKATIPDMPFVTQMAATGVAYITSAVQATPTIVGSPLSVTCPASGYVLVTATGESFAKSTSASSAYMGLAYSISLNSTASDAAVLVQSSALGVYNGDANRDFLSVQRVDGCSAGQTLAYRLTGFATTGTTNVTGFAAGSFLYNGRLVAQYFPN